MALTHLNPATLHRNPAFSQGVVIEPGSRLVIVGGQNGVDATGAVVGPGLGEQTVQALRNVLSVLHEVGATQEDVARLTIHLVAGSDAMAAFEASREVWGPHATAVTVLMVASLGRPECLVEIDALAAMPGRAEAEGPVRTSG
jgi:enamine deaminase RidA (YjgF/YER057c/UK114 family)